MKINWKTILKNVSFVILILKMCVVFGQKKVIVIDAGHGGKDSGAIGVNHIQEKDVVLNIANEILRLNKTILNYEFEIYLTRYKDTLISLSDRSRLAKHLNADVFVSLHCNASKKVTRGMEIYLHNTETTPTKPHQKAATLLAQALLMNCVQKLGVIQRNIKTANFQVLRETIGFCPSVLIETGFITNIDEAYYFLKATNIRAMALAILLGIKNYLTIGL